MEGKRFKDSQDRLRVGEKLSSTVWKETVHSLLANILHGLLQNLGEGPQHRHTGAKHTFFPI